VFQIQGVSLGKSAAAGINYFGIIAFVTDKRRIHANTSAH
jgi:hypothetical protein